MLNMSLVKLCVVGPPKIAMLLAKMTILYKGQSLNPKLLISSKPLDYLIKKKMLCHFKLRKTLFAWYGWLAVILLLLPTGGCNSSFSCGGSPN